VVMGVDMSGIGAEQRSEPGELALEL
jgi:hypothetical protein